MKTIIAGSRNVQDYRLVCKAVEQSKFPITEVVSGAARGVDQLGGLWAHEHGIPVREFPADWNGPAGKAAGFVRNAAMAEYADALIAVWDGRSRGTEHMIRVARKSGLHVFIFEVAE